MKDEVIESCSLAARKSINQNRPKAKRERERGGGGRKDTKGQKARIRGEGADAAKFGRRISISATEWKETSHRAAA